MTHRHIELDQLHVNRANDRHGELENETSSIAWLFNTLEQHMKNLAKDIVQEGRIYEPPLVWPEGDHFLVYDGNRRITCLKILQNPRRAPTIELQEYFAGLRKKWTGDFPERIECQIETDRDQIDDILFRRHTGSQNGVGQSTWTDRMKANFVNRTGKESGLNIADEIEKRLSVAGLLPRKKIPRSNLNRLLSAEVFRNRLGISVNKGKLEFIHHEGVALRALGRVADDLANRRKTLDDIWDVDTKRAYLDELDREGILPTAEHTIPKADAPEDPKAPVVRPPPRAQPQRRTTLIPNLQYSLAWSGRLQRHRAVWEELQFRLKLTEHPNAISVLLRVLFELSIENYIAQTSLTTISQNDSLAKRALRVAEDLRAKDKISQKYLETFRKFPQYDALVSADTMNRYVHSPNFAPSPEHLTALWDTLAEFIVHCLNA